MPRSCDRHQIVALKPFTGNRNLNPKRVAPQDNVFNKPVPTSDYPCARYGGDVAVMGSQATSLAGALRWHFRPSA